MTAISLPVVSEGPGLAQYLAEIKKFPLLSADEEFMLAKRWREHGETDAAHQLVTSHLRLVAKIAMKYRGYGLPMSDLISEGNVGLMKAVRKFDPDRGFRLSTYAMWWIRASVTEHILRSWSLVKLGSMAAQKKLFFSLRKAKANLKIFDSGELDPEDAATLSDRFNLSSGEITNMNRRMAARDFSLNAPVSVEQDSIEFMDTLVDESPSPEAIIANAEEADQRGAKLRDALATLPKREREIFIERRLKDDPVTLEQLGEVYGISRERVRQLEARAFDKVQKAVLAAEAAG